MVGTFPLRTKKLEHILAVESRYFLFWTLPNRLTEHPNQECKNTYHRNPAALDFRLPLVGDSRTRKQAT